MWGKAASWAFVVCLLFAVGASAQDKTSVLALAPANQEQLAAHPWLSDTTSAQRVAVYSPELGYLLAQEQKDLTAHGGPNFRRGTALMVPNDDRTGYEWELLTQKGADEYRVKRHSDEVQQRILLINTEYKGFISSGDDYSNLVAEGEINKPGVSTQLMVLPPSNIAFTLAIWKHNLVSR